MLVTQWEAFAVVAMVNIVTPGPTNLLIMNTSARLGRGPIIAFAFGNILGLGIIGMLVAAGFAQFIVKSAMAVQILRYVGGGYLIWLGIKLWRSDKIKPSDQREIGAKHAFRIALTNAVTNPKPLLFFGTVLPLFVSGTNQPLSDIAVCVLTFMAISFVSLNIYGSLADRAGALLQQEKMRKAFNRVCGATLIGYGGALALRQR